MPQKKSDDEFTLPALLGTFPYRQLGKRNIIETKVPFGCECVSSWEVAYNPPKRRYIIRRWYISGSLYTANWGIIYIYIYHLSPMTGTRNNYWTNPEEIGVTKIDIARMRPMAHKGWSLQRLKGWRFPVAMAQRYLVVFFRGWFGMVQGKLLGVVFGP